MYQNEHEIMHAVYAHFFSLNQGGRIAIDLRAPELVGTVQDDPFDSLVHQEIDDAFPGLEVVSSGKLTTPDIVIRDKQTGAIVGLEVKKLIQKPSGADARGLTMDYNSCLPCGTALVKVGGAVADIPCYYLFALLSNDSKEIVTLIVMHGDFLNYDFNLHKQAKIANTSEYGHGPYGEGSVRRRAMYTYPNPLNHKLLCFHQRLVFVSKELACQNLGVMDFVTHQVIREDLAKNRFAYSIVDSSKSIQGVPALIEDIFAECKARKARTRNTGAMPVLS